MSHSLWEAEQERWDPRLPHVPSPRFPVSLGAGCGPRKDGSSLHPGGAGGVGGRRRSPPFQDICPQSSPRDWDSSPSHLLYCGLWIPQSPRCSLMAPSSPHPSPGSPTLQALWVEGPHPSYIAIVFFRQPLAYVQCNYLSALLALG